MLKHDCFFQLNSTLFNFNRGVFNIALDVIEQSSLENISFIRQRADKCILSSHLSGNKISNISKGMINLFYWLEHLLNFSITMPHELLIDWFHWGLSFQGRLHRRVWHRREMVGGHLIEVRCRLILITEWIGVQIDRHMRHRQMGFLFATFDL